ncbi:hypothetical protein PV328_011964 [Microctonus aethiopoides]|uniref:Mutator-like transposase domain-containing protein n=1 Tax=Microctonus aethiopoides TaxID=144406 RepID=A0AA39FHB1_9HYME|nr:hypothetical protein PV328_011964 [Microctonus aethiopoides]
MTVAKVKDESSCSTADSCISNLDGKGIIDIKVFSKNLKCKSCSNLLDLEKSSAIHSGGGMTGLQKILSCANLPNISADMFKRYERIFGPAIEKTAEESCQKAAFEERRLVIENIEKLRNILPKHIVDDLYPNLETLRNNNSSNPSLPTESESSNIEQNK